MNPPEPVTYRLFVALEIPGTARAALADLLTQGQQRFSREVRWVSPANIHLTLKFIGDCEVERVADIRSRLDSALTGLPALTLALSQPGVFPNWRAPRVIWIGLGGQVAALGRLQQSVEGTLVEAGFPVERRPFRPHLTLGRVRDLVPPEARDRVGAWVRGRPGLEHPFTTSRVVLMRSVLSRQGSTYTEMAVWSLG